MGDLFLHETKYYHNPFLRDGSPIILATPLTHTIPYITPRPKFKAIEQQDFPLLHRPLGHGLPLSLGPNLGLNI